jgi:phosphoesterase RecJ-like protein
MNVVVQLLERLRNSTRVLLTGPEGPDGDSLGACLALQRLAAVAAPGVRVDVAGVPASRYAWMPGASAIVPDSAVGAYDGVVVLDGDRSRLPAPVARAFSGAAWTGLIDHHRSTDASLYDVALFAPTAESTCGMVAGLAREWGVPIDRDTASLLYAGMLFDTGGFRYSNTTADTLRLAADLVATGIDHAQIALRVLMERRPQSLRLMARILSSARFLEDGALVVAGCPRAWFEELGANDGDLEGIVDQLQHVNGVRVAVLAVERGPDKVKLSLRSSGAVDVASVARSLSPNGGGHAKAAGVALALPLADALGLVERDVGAHVRASV